MWHDIIPFCAFLFLSSAQGAFLRRLECGSSDNVPIDPIFQPDSLSGYLTSSHDGITTLSLKLSGDYESHDCEAIGGSLAQLSVDGRVLDRSVIANDQLLEFKGACSEHAPTQYPRSDPRAHAKYQATYALDHAYRMHTLAMTIQLRLNETDVACVATNITPYIGSLVSRLFKAVPLLIMLSTGIITGTLTICRRRERRIFQYELANASRDPAESYFPGMGDCLQYIQFIFLTGCLTLSYPGFLRAATGELAWSSLIFKNWPVTHQFAYQGVQDGIYATNATYGLDEMAQFLGATVLSDLWTNAVVNLALVVLGVIVISQLVLIIRLAWKLFPTCGSAQEINFRTEFLDRMQHTGWSVARIVLDYFLHPIVTFSLFQPLIARWFVYHAFFSISIVAVLAASLAFTVRHLVKNNRESSFFPRSSFPRRSSQDWLSDTLYGVPFLRGLAIGTLQTSGLGQIIVLMACEIFILAYVMLNRQKERIWRHVFFSTARLTIIAISCTFLPQAGVAEGKKAIVGYTIISLHATVMLTGFIVPCVYEAVEFTLCKLGILDSRSRNLDNRSRKAPIFGINQLSRRSARSMSFSQLPALSPTDVSIEYTQRPLSSHRSPFLGELPSQEDYPSFFRTPRSKTTPIPLARGVVFPSSSCQLETDSESSLESIELDSLDMDYGIRDDVDYSYREADKYYARPSTVLTSHDMQKSRGESSKRTEIPAKRFWKWKRRQKSEKGFEVIRPNRFAS